MRAKFSRIEDKRHAGYVEHKLEDVLILIMGAVLSGVTKLAGIMVCFSSKISFCGAQFGIDKYPSKPTLSRM